ncbi:MAG: L-seryl-tRNA(Sec) selenium transferase [Candidatus Krumholzibacteria bacterium]|nr:L-seryl-tRNA(Sec) selenium transferase [Candidatus Krumholzibacteria bacterium]
MTNSAGKEALKLIPSVDEVLSTSEIQDLRRRHARFPWTYCVRRVIDDVREGRLGAIGASRDQVKALVVASVAVRVNELKSGGMRRVINGTGVILHTNLGRAILGDAVCGVVGEAMAHYSNLEFDLKTGTRSHRGETLTELVEMATEAESAMIVNNNAAAVYLAVDSYSPPGRVLVSRGELVEIGGSFRLPDILEKAAERTIEVGTTNRTYIDDYARDARAGDILMRAHRSNYDIQGFTHEASLKDLVALARERECHVVFDLGSGSLFDFAGIGIEGEEKVKDVLATGVDCVTMSGDKLLGGVQAGIIVGRARFLDRLRRNPLRRTVRVDKITIAATQALMRAYLFGDDLVDDIPVLKQTTDSMDGLRNRAVRIRDGLPSQMQKAYAVKVVQDEAAMGGGSFAAHALPSIALSFHCGKDKEASALARRMRNCPVPVLARISGNEVRINLRTVLEREDDDLLRELEAVLGEPFGPDRGH